MSDETTARERTILLTLSAVQFTSIVDFMQCPQMVDEHASKMRPLGS